MQNGFLTRFRIYTKLKLIYPKVVFVIHELHLKCCNKLKRLMCYVYFNSNWGLPSNLLLIKPNGQQEMFTFVRIISKLIDLLNYI